MFIAIYNNNKWALILVMFYRQDLHTYWSATWKPNAFNYITNTMSSHFDRWRWHAFDVCVWVSVSVFFQFNEGGNEVKLWNKRCNNEWEHSLHWFTETKTITGTRWKYIGNWVRWESEKQRGKKPANSLRWCILYTIKHFGMF